MKWWEYVNVGANIATALGFCVLVYQITYQQRKDKIDKKIAENEAEDKERSFNLQLTQNRTQQFENTLFNLLEMFNGIVSQMNHTYHIESALEVKNISSSGRSVFNEAASQLYDIMENPISTTNVDEVIGQTRDNVMIFEARKRVAQNYHKDYYRYFEVNFNHYFRTLYHIFKYIDQSDLIGEDRKAYYSTIVRAQLSQNELLAVMFNLIIYDYGYPAFMQLDKKYDVLQNFDHSDPRLQPYYKLYQKIKTDIDLDEGEDGIEAI